jgi:hypothetical protein
MMPTLAEDTTTAAPASATPSWRLTLFARMWAAAALFHLAGNSRDALETSAGLAVTSVLLGAAAVLTLLAPRRLWHLVALCVFVPATAWYEAPVVGNHWVLASALSLALLLSAAAARLGRGRAGLDDVWHAFAPTARVTLLVAYGFAAFAKLNSDFFDPVVSCAVYYHNQLAGSWGLHLLEVADGDPAGRLLPLFAAVTEVTVALGLALPRTRRIGLVLAVGFHWLLAMDLAQHFWDFSAVLFAGFLLFLDEEQGRRLRRWTTWIAHRRGPGGLVEVALSLTAAAVVLLAVLPASRPADVLLIVLGHLAWWGYGTLVVLVVLRLAVSPHCAGAGSGALRVPAPVLYLVPVLVLCNGLTPYLELKTGFGWNMYSNLRTVDGESNHVLVRATLDLTGAQGDQVRILASSDAEVARLARSDYVLAYSEFREYAHAHPEVSVTYERAGKVVRAERLGDDAAGRGRVTALERRLQSFRVIDASGSERCQPVFSPAR